MAWIVTPEYDVQDFIDSLTDDEQAAVQNVVELLEEFGPWLGMPHAKPLGKGLRELRPRVGTVRIRLFFFDYGGGEFKVVNGTKEKGDMRKAITLARKRMNFLKQS